MSHFDLVIKNGEIITAAGHAGQADIGISDGLITQIGKDLHGREEIDARDKLVLPGGIDAHVHLTRPPGAEQIEPHWVDDFTSGSAAALAGGITTLGNMTFLEEGGSLLEGLGRVSEIAARQTIADLFLHPVLNKITPQVLEEIPKLPATGCNSLKVFMVAPYFDAQAREYLEAIRLAGENGMITMIHCEDHALIEDATARLAACGETGIPHYPESRTIASEEVATRRAIAIAEATGAPVYIVHLSSQRPLEACAQAQAAGLPVYVETRPLYLYFTVERFADPDGGKYVGQPPLRYKGDLEAIWSGLSQGLIHTLCTDHAPWSLAAKLDPAHDITNLRPGVADLQTMLPLLFSEGVRKGRISLARFVQLTASNTAKLFGLYPRKGAIAIGSHADLVVFDPELTRTVDPAMAKSNSDYTVFDGWQVTGWPEITLRRGEVVYREGEILAPAGSGRLVRRGAVMAL